MMPMMWMLMVFLSWRKRTGSRKTTRDRGATVRGQHRPRRLGFAAPLLLHKDRLSKVQGVQEVAGTHLAPVDKKLHRRDVVTTPDIALPALARGRAALTLEKCGLAPQLMNWMRRRGTSIDTLINHCPF